ncbi:MULTISPECIES: acetyl-CoA hydrolase/transferase family protein [Legionella]|uniref:acetyl-CoA hydrolase/transferase family protein n=1 Tax=Legionella TaxID=445 RepID=UPI00095FB9A6|nr:MULTISPECIES: acetyl-CoA hydrolase/transferase C-terminal domain-containing protein [Legionella]MBN9225841.1 acetyl-CoA hydrolase/transferase family protein [Legionella steelei]OJW07818.1 MAG: 4-hydroxybutyrate CoA-transferase [Legionella sp. 39-23]
MNSDKQYQQKLRSAKEAVNLIPSTAVISMGMRVSTPPALCHALAERAKAGDLKEVKVYYLRCGDVALKTIFQEELLHIIRPYSSMMSKGEVELAERGYALGKKHINFVPISFSRYPGTIKSITKLDAFIVTVSPMDQFGYFNLGTNGDYAIELARYANKLIVEVNENMPRTAGSTLIHVSEIDAIVENTTALLEEPSKPASELDRQIGQHITSLIPNGATIQMGIGGVPNAVCEQLGDHKDLGIHTEVITSGMIELIQKGVVTNANKTLNPFVNVFTFAIGDKHLYDFINNNPSMFCLPVSYVNEPNVIGKNNMMTSVNAFIEIDFSGQVNAEFIGHQFSGVGGQLDFIRGVHYSEGGKTIIASSSTAKQGTLSRIVPRLSSIATDTRLDIDYVVTEYGVAQLKGRSTTERTRQLIKIAHPAFREQLEQQAKQQGFI